MSRDWKRPWKRQANRTLMPAKRTTSVAELSTMQ